MKNLQSSNPLAKLALIALSTFPSLGGCSLGEWQGNSAEARPTADAMADSLEELVKPGGIAQRKVVSLGDVSSNLVSLNPQVSYVVEVPYGSYKQVANSITTSPRSWINRGETDDIYIFDVPKNPGQYRVKLERQHWCDREGWKEYDGTYLFLINTEDGNKTASVVKFPFKNYFSSEARGHGKLVLIRCEEDGKVYEVPKPMVIYRGGTHYVPPYIIHADETIAKKQPVEKL